MLVFGARVWSALHASDWRLREQALAAVLQYITHLVNQYKSDNNHNQNNNNITIQENNNNNK